MDNPSQFKRDRDPEEQDSEKKSKLSPELEARDEVLVWEGSHSARALRGGTYRIQNTQNVVRNTTQSLLALQVSKIKEGAVTNPEEERRRREQEEINREIQTFKPLLSVVEVAKGERFEDIIVTGWRPPQHVRMAPENAQADLRETLRIVVAGKNVPPPIQNFRDFRFPRSILAFLKKKGINKPTPIQMQGLSCVLGGRDMLGVAFTGSGKTLVFALPMVLFSLQEELKISLQPCEGPFGLVLCPSRELARQTWEIVCEYAKILYEQEGFPLIKALLCIGGIPISEQINEIKKGVHIVVATPGRLTDMLNKKRFTLKCCKFLTLDEADRLIDDFEEEVRLVIDGFSNRRQTVLFSATMPKKILEFAKSALVDPIDVNVGRAGAVNLDVIQEVEYVKQDNRLPYLLSCLQKTAPPVLIFCENKKDVDLIHEYLLLHEVDAVAIHGSKGQDERDDAVRKFKAGEKDVLVATDIASKGLDFPNIRHVINFDLPNEIENYVHRIGRTGRCGRRGVASTFINASNDELTLRDLAHLLNESKQRIPASLRPYLGEEDTISQQNSHGGCSFCGGLGHSAENCEKRLKSLLKNRPRSRKDVTGDY